MRAGFIGFFAGTAGPVTIFRADAGRDRGVRSGQKTARVEKPPAGALRSDHHRLVESFLRPTMKAKEGVERCIGVLGAPSDKNIGVTLLETRGPELREKGTRESKRST